MPNIASTAKTNRPNLVQVTDLWGTLKERIREFHALHDFECDGVFEVMTDLPAPRDELANSVVRVFEEMLNNVARHSDATMVTINVRAAPGDLTLLVKDNGRGAPPSVFEQRDAWGISHMKTRALAMGGWLQIDSQVGQGTKVILCVPLPFNASSTQPRTRT